MVNPASISWSKYGWETTFGSASTSINKTFGHGVKVTSLNRKNNLERVYGQGSRQAEVIQEKNFEGTVGLEWSLSNPWFFYPAMGTASVTGSGPYTHTFAEANTIPSLTIENDVDSSTASVPKLLGATMSTCSLNVEINSIATVKADFMYADESFATSTSSQVTESFDLYTFAHGTIEVPDGTTLAMVQSVEVTMNHNPVPIYGLGSRNAQYISVLNKEYQISINQAFQKSSDLLEVVYGASDGPASSITETADMVLTFTNGLTGSNERSITLTWSGVKGDEENMPQDPTSQIFEDATLWARSLSVTSVNGTTTLP